MDITGLTCPKNIFWCKDKTTCKELGVEKCQWKSWFYTSKAFSNECNGRSFAEVFTQDRKVLTHLSDCKLSCLANRQTTGNQKYLVLGNQGDRGQSSNQRTCHAVFQDSQSRIEPCIQTEDLIKPTNKVKSTNNKF